MTERKCLICGDEMRGRKDKKFCSDQCRNDYHNDKNSDDAVVTRKVHSTLKKNRTILNDLNPKETAKCKKEKLAKLGFNFNYFTNVYKTNAGKVYHYVYEQGYIDLDNGYVAIVRKKDYVD